ncbi:MAG: hypothetical protein NTZ07_00980 [Candidatus Woesebacteria bacterium]|nr:hypothetical protein [Candidatus Woesebacteria bacterium]
MEREKPDPVVHHNKRVFIAGVETGLLSLAGLIYPPAFLGMLVTIPEGLRQEILTFKELHEKLRRLENDVDELEQKVDEHIRSVEKSSDEPVPPNPKTATLEEIEVYKKSVLEAAQQTPDH